MPRESRDRSHTDRGQRRLHGRRKGHKLRPAQQRAVTELLPQLRVTLPAEGETLDLPGLFETPPRAIWLEIGFGGGEHLAWQAARNPDIGFIGVEVFQDGIAKLLRRVEDDGLRNVRIFHGDGRDLIDVLPEAAVERAFILFPDPWPKVRHHKRRFIQQDQLDALARVFVNGGELRLATDDPGYQRWMTVELTRHPAFEWTARRAADWRERGEDWPATRYEMKALGQGRSPIYLKYRRRTR